jgi:four helix bundle protein
MKSFEELICYQKAAEIRMKVSALVKTYPKEERYRLVDQMIRSSRSAPAQIAEGYGRFHFQENIQYCRQGRGSYYELIDHFIVSEEEKYISLEVLNLYKLDITECITVLNGYINYLAKAKSSSSKVEEPELIYETQQSKEHQPYTFND